MPALYFIYSYFIKGGFLDGVPGFYFVVNRMFYFYQIQAKIFIAKNGKSVASKTWFHFLFGEIEFSIIRDRR